MSNLSFKGDLRTGGTGIKTQLSLIHFIEDNVHIIYSPALDLTGYGNNEVEAKDSFQVVLGEFMTYGLNKKCLFEELKKLGWKVRGSKKKPKVESPDISDMMKVNADLGEVINKKDYTKYHQEVLIPAY
ncbi:hypothetical protein C943_03298 [Mariniradius saccharolyticus AK6]|uniref:Uncharacterized protein n=1 Tax=Mariniradius saccharolyticus AK6 TaxID=1239962 RepID=M7YBP5_9BACT|nr:hypothetical protein [Mariniradius saccharolyticus]EMS34611.1 hypothetical protein C943_03298 [Mariniradius saccharolyticus AK6]